MRNLGKERVWRASSRLCFSERKLELERASVAKGMAMAAEGVLPPSCHLLDSRQRSAHRTAPNQSFSMPGLGHGARPPPESGLSVPQECCSRAHGFHALPRGEGHGCPSPRGQIIKEKLQQALSWEVTTHMSTSERPRGPAERENGVTLFGSQVCSPTCCHRSCPALDCARSRWDVRLGALAFGTRIRRQRQEGRRDGTVEREGSRPRAHAERTHPEGHWGSTAPGPRGRNTPQEPHRRSEGAGVHPPALVSPCRRARTGPAWHSCPPRAARREGPRCWGQRGPVRAL